MGGQRGVEAAAQRLPVVRVDPGDQVSLEDYSNRGALAFVADYLAVDHVPLEKADQPGVERAV